MANHFFAGRGELGRPMAKTEPDDHFFVSMIHI